MSHNLQTLQPILDEINSFLTIPTPQSWLDVAINHIDILLIDHANCEKKAANMGMTLMYKYTNKAGLLKKMSQLAREEILHFEQVVTIMQQRGIEYRHLSSSPYANHMHQHISKGDGLQLIDTLIVGAIIEARSCERFAKLVPCVDAELAKFYYSLLRSEGRHYQDYLALAQTHSNSPITPRIEFYLKLENQFIQAPDKQFRFHSGVPYASVQ